MRLGRRWWVLVAAVPLACLPLVAQETAPPPAEPAKPAPPPASESAPEASKPADPPADAKVAEQAAAEGAPEERVSADNNLSFPVDI